LTLTKNICYFFRRIFDIAKYLFLHCDHGLAEYYNSTKAKEVH